ncbi:RNA polymerase sigma factor [Nocardiopsis dassonvillei]|uniref:RNA polymerase sigma factor n=1 Tax=Nocardiopsis dassonvillei TaxID=2014 RepID=UPI0034014F17
MTHEHKDDPYYQQFKEGFVRWAPNVRRVLKHMGATSEETDDAMQAAVVSILHKRPDMREPRTYLTRAARNKYLSMVRAHRHTDDIEEENGLDTAAPSSLRPENRVVSSELQDRLLTALRSLPSAHREAFVLHADEDYSYAEIAQITGRKENTVCQHYKRAVDALRELLRE